MDKKSMERRFSAFLSGLSKDDLYEVSGKLIEIINRGLLAVPGRVMACVASEALDIPYSNMSFVCGGKTYYLCDTTPSRLPIGCMPPGITFGGKTVDEWLHTPDIRGYGYYFA